MRHKLTTARRAVCRCSSKACVNTLDIFSANSASSSVFMLQPACNRHPTQHYCCCCCCSDCILFIHSFIHYFIPPISHHTVCSAITALKPHSARTRRTVFSQLSAAVVRHKANDGYSMRSERGLSTILHCLQWYKLVLRTRISTAAVLYLRHNLTPVKRDG